jgi:hypothetical protein
MILVFFLLPYPTLKAWVDGLAQDGAVELFTPAIAGSLRRALSPIGLILLGLAISGVLFRRRWEQWIEATVQAAHRFAVGRASEVRLLLGELSIGKSEQRYLLGVLAITLLAGFNRAVYLMKPMGHDEAYTFMGFVSQGIFFIISDYHLPNNHVFHSLLVFISTGLFGNDPWAVRLPAFLAGVLLVPAIFLVARAFAGERAGLISAGLAASAPVFVDYSSNARGYLFIALFSVLLVGLGTYLKQNRNLVAWLAFIVLAALGFYTIPIMLYPFGMVMFWLFLSMLFGEVSPAYGNRFLVYLVLAGVAVAVLSTLLYAPILYNSGFQALAANEFVESRSWDYFRESLPVRVRNTWQEWNRDVPDWASLVLILGFAASFTLRDKRRRSRVLLILATILWLGVVLVLQRVAPWPRVWLFLLPFAILYTGTGLAGLIGLVRDRVPSGRRAGVLLLTVCLVLPLVASLLHSGVQLAQARGQTGAIEHVTLFLKDYLEPGDAVVSISPDGVLLRYYFYRYGLSREYTADLSKKDLSRAIVVVNQGEDQTLDQILNRRGLLEQVDLNSAEMIYQVGRILVYEVHAEH